MKTIEIPRKKLSGDLVVLERRDYDRLVTLANDRFELQKNLHRALDEIERDETIGPFDSVDALMASLV